MRALPLAVMVRPMTVYRAARWECGAPRMSAAGSQHIRGLKTGFMAHDHKTMCGSLLVAGGVNREVRAQREFFLGPIEQRRVPMWVQAKSPLKSGVALRRARKE